MLKRFAAILLALALLSGGVLASAADENNTTETQQSVVEEKGVPTFSVSSATAKPGDTVQLTVDMSNNPGITSLMLSLSYNDTYLSLASEPALGELFPESVGGEVSVVPYRVLSYNGEGEVKEDGSLVTLTFKVADNAPSGDYKVVVSYEEEAVFNAKIENVSFETVAGKITVEGDVPPVSAEDAPAVYEPILDKPGTDEPKEEEALIVPKFADTSGHWAVKYINDSVDLGFFRGDENGNFNPEQKITRAQFITVLWRMAGSPDMEATHSFDDVDGQSEEFQRAIAWGHGKGYVSGISDTEFDPNGVLTREAGMKMLHYYAGGKVGQEAMFYNIYDQLIHDSADISQWAKKSVYWGIYYELISGTDDLTISPKSAMTRAQMAKIMVSYHNNLAS